MAKASRQGVIQTSFPIPPGAWLGLLGGGQLGRMFCMAAQSLGYKVVVLDPGNHSPAGSVADQHVHADYLDRAGLARLASLCRAATTEFENVPASALEFLSRTAHVTPTAASVAIAQDRIREKNFLAEHGFGVVPFVVLESAAAAARVDAGLTPGIVKSARLGYDGKGQIRVRTPQEVSAAFVAMGKVPCVLEKFVDLACEVSIIVARTATGETTTWPVAENRHRDGILDVSIVPARIDADLAEKARDIATRVANALDYRGVLCVEMFVTSEGALLVNEIAPRPHNSGHYTIDACVTSQFEQQARILAGLPLGNPRLHECAVMVNLLGDLWLDASDARREPDWASILSQPDVKLHLYGKGEPRRGRKMGHITCLGATLPDALRAARKVKQTLAIPGVDEL
ncbi:MAG TPA: 5-(carboxyamino)imidazole ribonucleotide synthase [Casimicrobiaceae bacterium]|nr:5-(carboxyamino)imidazole ribonucleotide synthase [Casimicrobiaceae bacterium]